MAKRIDDNQREIVSTFRKIGASVQILSDVGRGCPDIIVGMFGKNFLVEIKNGKKPPSAQRLTEKEQSFFDTWKGHVCIVRSVEDAVGLFRESIPS
jgi:hypothetical protein